MTIQGIVEAGEEDLPPAFSCLPVLKLNIAPGLYRGFFTFMLLSNFGQFLLAHKSLCKRQHVFSEGAKKKERKKLI